MTAKIKKLQTTGFVHPTCELSPQATIGPGSYLWMNCQIREGAILGKNVIIGKGVYIDKDVRVGDQCKVQNHSSLFQGVVLEAGVFIGPHVCFTNDRYPRAVTSAGTLKSAADWKVESTLVKTGSSIGAGSVIVCGVTIGRWAMVGAGSVVTKNIPDFGLVVGNPAVPIGFVCLCGKRQPDLRAVKSCSECGGHER